MQAVTNKNHHKQETKTTIQYANENNNNNIFETNYVHYSRGASRTTHYWELLPKYDVRRKKNRFMEKKKKKENARHQTDTAHT